MVQRILSNDYLVVVLAVLDLALGLILYATGQDGWANVVLGFGALAGVLPFFLGMIREIGRGNFGVDILAVTAIVASLALGEYLAAIVILIMLTGGEALETYAQGRAHKELSDLLARAPKLAHRYRGDVVEDVPADVIQ